VDTLHAPSFDLSPFLQSLLENRTITFQEIRYGSLGLFMLLFILQSFECSEVSPASIFQRWDRKFGKLVLRRKSSIDLWIWVKFSDWVSHRDELAIIAGVVYIVRASRKGKRAEKRSISAASFIRPLASPL